MCPLLGPFAGRDSSSPYFAWRIHEKSHWNHRDPRRSRVGLCSRPEPPEQTWKGKISDSMCKDKHAAGEHDGKKMTDADCTSVCVKNGSKYVSYPTARSFSWPIRAQRPCVACRSGSEADGRVEGRHHHRDEDCRSDQAREVTENPGGDERAIFRRALIATPS